MVRVPLPFEGMLGRRRRRRDRVRNVQWVPLPGVYHGRYLCDRRGRFPHYQYRMVWHQTINDRRTSTWEPVEQLVLDGWIVEMDRVNTWVEEGRPRTFRRWAREQGFL